MSTVQQPSQVDVASFVLDYADIEAGYGMYRAADGAFKAVACSGDNQFGAPSRLYGLTASPCR